MSKEDGKGKASGFGGTGKQPSSSRQSHEWFNPQLRTEDVQWLESNSESLAALILSLLDELTGEEKLSLKYDSYSSRWMAILFSGDGDARNSGVAMSVRGATPFDALVALAYLHLVRFEGEWATNADKASARWG